MIYLDTPIVVWLYDGLVDKLSSKAQEAINTNEVRISSMVKLELALLHEIKRLKAKPGDIIHELTKTIGLRVRVADFGFSQIIENALDLKWSCDPFDRVIVAEAMIDTTGLVTKDRLIRKHYKFSIW